MIPPYRPPARVSERRRRFQAPAERRHGRPSPGCDSDVRSDQRAFRRCSISRCTSSSVMGLRKYTSHAFITRPIPQNRVRNTGHGHQLWELTATTSQTAHTTRFTRA